MTEAQHSPPGRVILTHGRSLHTLVAAQSLGRRGVEVFGCDPSPLMALSFSRYVRRTFLTPLDEEGPGKFLDALERKVREYRPPEGTPYVLMPMDRHTKLIAAHRDRFEPTVRVAAPDVASIRQVDPKTSLVHTARRLGVPIPPTWMPATEEELLAVRDEIPFPAIVKLPDGTGGVGVEKVDGFDQLLATYRRFRQQFGLGGERPALVQQAVGADDYCVTVLMDRGRLRAHMTYKNLTTLPGAGGFGVFRETVDAPELVDISARLLAATDWHGVAELDFRWDGPGTPAYLIEVNARFWGGLFQSVESGVDYPWLLYQLTAFGATDDAPEPAVGTRTRIPVVSFVGELHDLWSDDDRFRQMQSSLSAGWAQLRRGSLLSGLGKIADGLTDLLNPADRLRQLGRWLRDNDSTRTEIFSTDDPAAALGALYVLGSLVRTGKLPAEIARGEGAALLENPYAEGDDD